MTGNRRGGGAERERRAFAVEAGIRLDEQDLPALRELAIEDEADSVRRAAVWAVARFGLAEDADLFLHAIDDAASTVRSVAGWALWRLGPEALPDLTQSMAAAPTERARDTARRIAARIERAEPAQPVEPVISPPSPDPVWVEGAVHDLLNIVQGIVGELDELGEEEGIPDEVMDRVRSAEEASRFLLEVGGSLLDVGRLEASGTPIERVEVDVVEIAKAAAVRGRPPGDRDRVKVLSGAERITIGTDRTRLLRILLNLVWNACKHSSRADPVRVVVRQHSTGVIVEVRDRGPGIPPEERARVRDAFQTGAKTLGAGWGLGLSTALRLARQIGAEISISDRPTAGTCAIVHLPRVAQVVPDLPARSESSG